MEKRLKLYFYMMTFRIYFLNTLLLFFLSAAGSFAQNYTMFPDSNALWVESGVYEDTYALCMEITWETTPVYYEFSHVLGEKEVLNNKVYTKVYHYGGAYCTILNSGGVQANLSWAMPSYIREDSGKKVYASDGTNEYVLYDFNLETGDTLRFFNFQDYVYDVSNYVSAIDSIQIGASYRKRFWISKFPDQYPVLLNYASITEGIGCSWGLFMNTFLAFWSWDSINLNCFSYNGQILYPQTDSSNCIVTSEQSINASLDNAMQIFPNPANKWMTIKDQSFDAVTNGFICDMAGHRIKNFSITSTAPLINIEDIQPGIYIITCETKKQIRSSNIFIKQ